MTVKGLLFDASIAKSLKVIKVFNVFLLFDVTVDFDIIRIAIHLPIGEIFKNWTFPYDCRDEQADICWRGDSFVIFIIYLRGKSIAFVSLMYTSPF